MLNLRPIAGWNVDKNRRSEVAIARCTRCTWAVVSSASHDMQGRCAELLAEHLRERHSDEASAVEPKPTRTATPV